MILHRPTLIAASLAGVSAILLGAFGAHGMEDLLLERGVDADVVPRRLAQFDTGARYHLAHAIVLLVLSGLPVCHCRTFQFVKWFIVAGLFFFSGSLYLLVVTNTPVLGAITPIGGVCWIGGWFMMLFLNPRSETAKLAESEES